MEVSSDDSTDQSEVERSARRINDILSSDFIGLQEKAGLVGFRNLGDTCFMNSTLQCLVHCPQLVGLFCSSEFELDFGAKAPLVQDFGKLMRQVWLGRLRVLAPQDILRDVMKLNEIFQGYQQQDAQELLLTLLGNLDDMTQRVLTLPPTEKDCELLAKIEAHKKQTAEVRSKAAESIEVGEIVVIEGLEEDNYNGYEGEVVASINEKGRIGVKVHKLGDKCLSLKPANLIRQQTIDDAEDAQMEDKAEKKKLKPPPIRRAFRSPITDVFSGRLQNECTCLECGHVSKSLNPFQDLSLPIPNTDMVDQAVEERNATPPPKQGVLQWLGITNSQTTLDICLHSFCTSEELIESDQYHCEKCKRKVNAKKVMSIAILPEILICHIKRFNYSAGFWGGSKKSTIVEFSDELDMRGYLHSDFLDHPQNENSEYELYGFVRHLGSLSGGHYVAYCRKPSDAEVWYCFDDRSVYEVDLSEALKKEAYLLFYCKRNDLEKKKRHCEQMWNICEKHLIDCNNKDSEDDVYICSYFFQKLKHYSHVGSLDNHRLLCPHGFVMDPKDERWKHNCVRLPRKTWNALEEQFPSPQTGDIPIIQHSDLQNKKFDCKQCQAQKDYRTISNFMNEKYNTKTKYIIPQKWADNWRDFADANPTPRVVPPGPIDVASILDEEGKPINEKFYISVNEHVWNYLVGVHGGGPATKAPVRVSRSRVDSQSTEASVEDGEEGDERQQEGTEESIED